MDKGMIVGIDLSCDYTQISYIDENKNVISVSVSENMQPYLIPSVMFYNTDIKEWSIGIEALNKKKIENGVLFDNAIEDISKSGKLEYGDLKFDGVTALSAYFHSLFSIVRKYCGMSAEKCVVSIENLDERFMEIISKTMERLDISNDAYRIISHSESYIYYTLNQSSELWINKVMLFDLNKNRFTYRKLFATKGRKPLVAEVSSEDISSIVNVQMLESEKGRTEADNTLCEFILGELSANVVSAVFFIGKGFEQDWCPKTINSIRGNRRIFKGFNMISKGAGYAAREFYSVSTLGDYVFSCPGRTQVNVYLAVEQNEHEQHLQLSKAGDNWYQAGAYTECIVNRTDVMKLVIQWPVTRETKNVFIDLSSLPERPNKTTRLGITMAFIDDSSFVISAKDMGFGDFFEASSVEIKETINLKHLS